MRLLLTGVLSLVVLGCSGTRKPSSPRVEPPQVVGRGRPELRLPPGPPRQGTVLDIRLEIMVDAAGQPDLNTLKLTGQGAGEKHAAIVDWLRTVTFRPARQGGVPVAATYTTAFTAETRVEVRRSP